MKQLTAKTPSPLMAMRRASTRAINQGTKGMIDELRQAGPGQHKADLLGVVATNTWPRYCGRRYTPCRKARSRRITFASVPKPKFRPANGLEINRRVSGLELDPDEQRQKDGGDQRKPHDQGGIEPTVTVAFVEHGLQRREPDRHRADAEPVPLREQRKPHRLRARDVNHSTTTMMAPGTRLTKKIYCQP